MCWVSALWPPDLATCLWTPCVWSLAFCASRMQGKEVSVVHVSWYIRELQGWGVKAATVISALLERKLSNLTICFNVYDVELKKCTTLLLLRVWKIKVNHEKLCRNFWNSFTICLKVHYCRLGDNCTILLPFCVQKLERISPKELFDVFDSFCSYGVVVRLSVSWISGTSGSLPTLSPAALPVGIIARLSP